MVDLRTMPTEAPNPRTSGFSAMSVEEAVAAMNREDQEVAQCVRRALPQVAQVVRLAVDALERGGRVVYLGAGTSGRLGLLDAVECPPTFGVAPGVVVGLMAGGGEAFSCAQEGAEDRPELARRDLRAIGLGPDDLLVGLTASGRTPYVLGGLAYAREAGCPTAAVVCNPGSPVAKACPCTVEVLTGAEALTGSTRLKAGTATKMVLNMISTVAMAQTGKVYRNYMVDLKVANQKLAARGRDIVCAVTGAGAREAEAALTASSYEVKTAIAMLLCGEDAPAARKRLARAGGRLQDLEVCDGEQH